MNPSDSLPPGQPSPWPRVRIGSLWIDSVDLAQAVGHIVEAAAGGKAAYVVTPNADHVVRAERDADYRRICAQASLVVADGMPLVWAARWLGRPLPTRVAGSDLMPALCQRAAELGKSIFLLGGLAGEAELALVTLRAANPTLRCVGQYSPPFGFEVDSAECQKIVAMVNAARPDFVFVGLGSPKQERWISAWRPQLCCGALLGVGISIAFLAGTVRRAPVWMQNSGLEWLFRLAQEPRRLTRRYIGDLAFFALVWRQRREVSPSAAKRD